MTKSSSAASSNCCFKRLGLTQSKKSDPMYRGSDTTMSLPLFLRTSKSPTALVFCTNNKLHFSTYGARIGGPYASVPAPLTERKVSPLRRQHLLTTACMVGLFTLPAAAQVASQQSTEQQIAVLRAEIQELKAKQAKLEAAAAQAPVASPRPGDPVAQTQAAVAQDAARRSSLISESNLTRAFSSYDPQKGFVFRSEDGSFSLHPWVQFQFRGVTDYRNDVNGDSDTQTGFEMRRMKFGVDGNAYSPDTAYLFSWQADRNTGNVSLEEAWVRTKLSSDFYIRGGQFKDPFAHESLVSSKKLMSADRTLATDVLAGADDYIQGVAVNYSHDALQAEVAVTDGHNESNRNFQDFPTNAWDFGLAGRVQYKLMGDWGAYDQFTALGLKKDLLVVGGGADLSQGGNTDQFLHTVDVHYANVSGLAAFGAIYGRYTANAPKSATVNSANEHDTYDWGLIAQASYVIPETRVEPFARYDYIGFDADTVAAGAEQHVHEFTGGVNYYLHGQSAKFTLDVTYLPNGTPAGAADVLTSTDAEFLLQAQFQLLL
ncbi:hypothetical protein BH10PLA1_BH10PLA1_08070 [soil metagenome]